MFTANQIAKNAFAEEPIIFDMLIILFIIYNVYIFIFLIICKYKGKISNNNDLFLKYLFYFFKNSSKLYHEQFYI